ncbi:MAG TPA: hypothetical protein VNM48_18765 [Chloroflexota bacterium]|nr:hypothetical protein [Chloroflexota bacterium]
MSIVLTAIKGFKKVLQQAQNTVLLGEFYDRVDKHWGTLAVGVNGGYTFSLAELDYGAFVCTGAGGTLNIGTTKGSWVITNGCSGALTVGAVSIPSGQTAYVRSDGGTARAISAGDVEWASISNKPSAFPPSAHNHDDLYYIKSVLDAAFNSKSNADHSHPATWTPVGTFLNGWVNYGVGYPAASYLKDTTNRVWLKGTVKTGTVPSAVFTLPVGFRPLDLLLFPTVTGATNLHGALRVTSDGNVVVLAGDNALFAMNGISFLAA